MSCSIGGEPIPLQEICREASPWSSVTSKARIRIVIENVEIGLLAEKLLGSCFDRRKTGEIELEEDGFFACCLLELLDRGLRLRAGPRREVDLGVVLQESPDRLLPHTGVCTYNQT